MQSEPANERLAGAVVFDEVVARSDGVAVTVDLAQTSINTIRTLAIDAVQAASSGHPGAPMALAPVVYSLWQHTLRYDPHDPAWPNRDRFVLSNGHASMLLYAILHLAGVQGADESDAIGRGATITLDEIRRFRQLHSLTPGHPEYGVAAGVETTTGPLGQGVATSVGMAIAARWLTARFNRPRHELFDYDTYVLCSDGDLMEGVASEAASLAGHLGLSNLCWIYDNNRITIEGATSLTFSEDVPARFIAYGWHVVTVADANDIGALDRAFAAFRATADRPTLIVVDSHIGYGSPKKQDTAGAHSDPLGVEEIQATKRAYGWPEDASFLIPDGVYEHFRAGVGERGAGLRGKWRARLNAYGAAYPELAEQLAQVWRGDLPVDWDATLPSFPADEKGMATRDASGLVLNALAAAVPWVLGGSADLGPSTKTKLTFAEAGELTAANPGGRNLHFGVREHVMGAVVNGLALAGLRAYGSTFLIFSDYQKPAIRLSALMELPAIHVFSHDSIGVGEDGPTHQPIEQLATLRATPNLIVLRPADANEVTEAWRVIMQLRDQPAALVLTRQAVPTLDRQRCAPASGLRQGAYVLLDAEGGDPEVVLLATGSEVSLCVAAYAVLTQGGVRARVVSMPSWELFEQQDAAYRAAVLPPRLTARVAVEQGATLGWERYVGLQGEVLGMHSFGASAPIKDLQNHFGFTVARVVEAARAAVARATATAPSPLAGEGWGGG